MGLTTCSVSASCVDDTSEHGPVSVVSSLLDVITANAAGAVDVGVAGTGVADVVVTSETESATAVVTCDPGTDDANAPRSFVEFTDASGSVER